MGATPQSVTRKPGFIREALGELRRKLQRRKLRRQLRQQEGERNQAILTLGKRAWEAGIDLSAFPFVRDRLTAAEGKSRELADTSTRLQAEKAELERKRQGEVAAFDNRRRPIDENKQRAELELKSARARLTAEDRGVKQAEHRLAELGIQLLALEKAAGAAATPGTPVRTVPNRVQLVAEQAKLAEGLPASRASLEARTEEVNRWASDSGRYAEAIAALEAERRATLAPLDAALDRVRGQLTAAAQETTGLGTQREELFRHLGLALHAGQTQEPALSEEMQQIGTFDQARAANNALLEASLALTRAVPRHTMLKFWTLGVLLSVLVIGMGVWLYSFIPSSREGERSNKMATIKAPALSESEKDAVVTTFVDSLHSRAPAPDEKKRVAVNVLMEDILNLGSTGDRKYLPVLVRVLRSDVPDLRAAAADAIGMIGPTTEQTASLTAALNDPVPAVRLAAVQALAASADPSAKYLVSRAQRARFGYLPEPVPGEKELGVHVYPGAKFLYFASNLGEGRAAFSAADAPSSIIDFYVGKVQRPSASQAGTTSSGEVPKAGVPTELSATTKIPGLADYMNQQLYGNPMIVVLRESESTGGPSPTHFVVVFEDLVLKQTGFVLHFIPPAPPPRPGGEAGGIIE